MPQHFARVEDVVDALLPSYPVYCLRPTVLRRQVRRFCALFPGTVLYAVKCNPHPLVLDALYDAGIAHFDTASLPEIAAVAERYGDATCYFMHPVKSRAAIQAAYGIYGVRHYVVDHPVELAKLLDETPARDLTIVVRLKTPADPRTVYDLSSKFGCDVDTAVGLLGTIDAAGCHGGLAFHVGSQCGAPGAYATALALVGEVIARVGRAPALVDVGGGFPAEYVGTGVPALEVYLAEVRAGLARLALPPDTALLAEPGRVLVADACSLLVQIQLRKAHALYLNDGIFGSLSEMALSSLRMPIRLIRRGGTPAKDTQAFMLYGPTCDSLDVLPGQFELPADAREGDWLEIGQLGAYSNALTTRFNGFFPETFVTITA
ncbi:MAG: type III PLP-dependent enzyme [Gammaproteobacteria bacterium]